MHYPLLQIKRCVYALSRQQGKAAQRIVFFAVFLPFSGFFLPLLLFGPSAFVHKAVPLLLFFAAYEIFFRQPLAAGVHRRFAEIADGSPHRSGLFFFFSSPILYFRTVFFSLLLNLFRLFVLLCCLFPGVFASITAHTAAKSGGAIGLFFPLCALSAAGLSFCGGWLFLLFLRPYRLFFRLFSADPSAGFFTLLLRCRTLYRRHGQEMTALFRRTRLRPVASGFWFSLWLPARGYRLCRPERKPFVPFHPQPHRLGE